MLRTISDISRLGEYGSWNKTCWRIRMSFLSRSGLRLSAVWFQTVRFPRTRLICRQLKCSKSEMMDLETFDVEGWIRTNVWRILVSSWGSSDNSDSWHLCRGRTKKTQNHHSKTRFLKKSTHLFDYQFDSQKDELMTK